MANSSVAGDLNESLDILRYFATQIAFYFVILLNNISESGDFFFGEISNPGCRVYFCLNYNLAALGFPIPNI